MFLTVCYVLFLMINVNLSSFCRERHVKFKAYQRERAFFCVFDNKSCWKFLQEIYLKILHLKGVMEKGDNDIELIFTVVRGRTF